MKQYCLDQLNCSKQDQVVGDFLAFYPRQAYDDVFQMLVITSPVELLHLRMKYWPPGLHCQIQLEH